MKKLYITIALIITNLVLNAQIQLTTKNFDLETQNKHKDWYVIDAGIDANNQQPFVKFALPKCNTTTSSDNNSVTTSFKGVSWQIDKLHFDVNFNYLSTEEKSYASSVEAISNNEIVYGKKFKATSAEGAFTFLAMPSGQIDNSFMGTYIVGGFANMSGFKLGTSFIGAQSTGEINKWGTIKCIERAIVHKINMEDSKEQKGQRWIPIFNHAIPNGGNILFNTSGVNKEEKQHYIFRKYNSSLEIIKEKTFTFDYQCLMYIKEIEKAPGQFDYVLVTLPIDYKKSKLPTAPANSYEYFYVDGSTYEIKENLTILAPNSQWLISQVYSKDGAVYLCGDSGKTAITYADFAVPNPKNYPNFQLAKIENSKLVYVKNITPEHIKAALINVNGEKTKSDLNFKLHVAQMDVVNGKFIYGGRFENIKNAIFNQEGDLEAFIVKNAEFSENYFTFSKDKKNMYCLVQNVLDYNKWDDKTGVITPKSARQVITSLSIISYNFENKIAKYEDFKNENWGVKFSNQILLDNDDSLLLLGTNITKKAKDSEMVFISIKK